MFDGQPQNGGKKGIISRCGSAVLDSKCLKNKKKTLKNTSRTVWRKASGKLECMGTLKFCTCNRKIAAAKPFSLKLMLRTAFLFHFFFLTLVQCFMSENNILLT